MTAPIKRAPVLEPPYPGLIKDIIKFFKHYTEIYERTGGATSSIPDLKGLVASVDELNTLVGIQTDKTVQTQINEKADSASLGTMSTQNSDSVNITGGTISNTNVRIPVGSFSLNLSGTLYQSLTTTGNNGVNPTNLIVFQIPANILNNEFEYLKVIAFGSFASNANNKQLELVLGSTVLFDTTSLAANGGSWYIENNIYRISDTSGKSITKIVTSNATVADSANYIALTEDFTTALNIFCRATGVNDNDIIQEGLNIEWAKY